MQVKTVAVFFWLGFLTLTLGLLFWYNELVYQLPTPVPAGYQAVAIGTGIQLPVSMQLSSRPLFLHFFNPDCPCSRFNLPHFRSLVSAYSDRVDFAIVPMVKEGRTVSVEEIQYLTGVDVPVLLNSGLAEACGVYSTPQAVLLRDHSKLYYRGNYNKSRYCTDKKSNYAQMALDSLLRAQGPPVFGRLAQEAYGCQIPICGK
jgi:hypothetical protein